MLNNEQTNAVFHRLEELVKLSEKQFGRSFPFPSVVKFDVRGTKGGFHRSGELHFNPILYLENQQHYLIQTVGHEFAHYVQRIMFPTSKPHGWEWKLVMRALGLTPDRCHSYDTSNARVCRRVHKKYEVVCQCSTHLVTMRLLTKIRAGRKYKCKHCRTHVKEKLDTGNILNTMVVS